jgi:hypothetical protein
MARGRVAAPAAAPGTRIIRRSAPFDNSGGETEHDLVVPAFGFRLQANAGETARKSTVERVEGFATNKEWRRAYREINEFELMLVDSGIRLVKLFLHKYIAAPNVTVVAFGNCHTPPNVISTGNVCSAS